MGARRCRYDIYASILAYVAAAGRARVTEIARFSNLPLNRAKRYLREMAELGLIREYSSERGRFYAVTERGFEYTALYRRIRALVG